jgi:hypothetical protein
MCAFGVNIANLNDIDSDGQNCVGQSGTVIAAVLARSRKGRLPLALNVSATPMHTMETRNSV